MNGKLVAAIVVGAIVIGGGAVGLSIMGDASDIPGQAGGNGGTGGGAGTETDLTPIPTQTAPSETQTPGEGTEETTESSRVIGAEEQIQRALATRINAHRTDEGLTELTTGGRHANQLEAIAMAHSRAMAQEQTVQSSIAGNTTTERYKRTGLYDVCTYATGDDTGLVEPEFGRTELIANPVSVADYQQPSDGYGGNALAVANTTVGIWRAESETRKKLEYQNARQMGVGVTRTDRNEIYVAVTLCDD